MTPAEFRRIEADALEAEAFHLALAGHSAAIETGVDSDSAPRLIVDGVAR